jgi:hypothetical protein
LETAVPIGHEFLLESPQTRNATNSNTAEGEEVPVYSLVPRKAPLRFFLREGLPGVLALLVAEVFYKFHSFTLECLAFLATWFLFSYLLSVLTPRRTSKEQS